MSSLLDTWFDGSFVQAWHQPTASLAALLEPAGWSRLARPDKCGQMLLDELIYIRRLNPTTTKIVAFSPMGPAKTNTLPTFAATYLHDLFERDSAVAICI